MSRFLDSYRKQRVELTLEMGDHPSRETFLRLQELTYRIGVYETFQTIYSAAKAMAYTNPADHYRMFDGFVSLLMSERIYKSKSPEIEAKRETVFNTMVSFVDGYRKKYSRYVFKYPCNYIDDISETMNTFLSVWLAHRNTYFEIKGV